MRKLTRPATNKTANNRKFMMDSIDEGRRRRRREGRCRERGDLRRRVLKENEEKKGNLRN